MAGETIFMPIVLHIRSKSLFPMYIKIDKNRDQTAITILLLCESNNNNNQIMLMLLELLR